MTESDAAYVRAHAACFLAPIRARALSRSMVSLTTSPPFLLPVLTGAPIAKKSLLPTAADTPHQNCLRLSRSRLRAIFLAESRGVRNQWRLPLLLSFAVASYIGRNGGVQLFFPVCGAVLIGGPCEIRVF